MLYTQIKKKKNKQQQKKTQQTNAFFMKIISFELINWVCDCGAYKKNISKHSFLHN